MKKDQHSNDEPPIIEEVIDILDEMAIILQGLIIRARLPWLLRHHKRRSVLALFSFINGCISIGLIYDTLLLASPAYDVMWALKTIEASLRSHEKIV